MRLLPLLLVAVLLVGCDSGGEGKPAPRPATPRAITKAELGEHLEALQEIADRNGGTRAAGTPGYDASADYVAKRLREARWRVRLQPVRFAYFNLRSASMSLGDRKLREARDFQVLSYSGAGRADGRLRRLGDGCGAAQYSGLGAGDVPLVTRGICFFREKAFNAQKAGARALVVIDDSATRRGVPSGTLAAPGIRIPVVLVADTLVREGAPVRVEVDASSGNRVTHNVIAETPGGKGERVVMAGGHLDSVRGGPGVNDNGSGAAALIEAAKAIGPDPPGSRVRLAFWGAEELGLLGSRHYVRSLDRAERKRISAYINFDMVGSPNAVPEFYADGDAELGRVLRRAAGRPLGGVSVGGASDHASFMAAGVPVNGLYTGANERGPGGRPRDACYHLACDSVERVNRPVLLRMARAGALALKRLSARHK
ncbi:MAG TPA: M20/M25/M40 family metallo-hydrolase [Thermoleophilaceae bacterium]|nr:M20/M25/M40 family metallo-hydrolase [Thermoleophilaceae bacterium]